VPIEAHGETTIQRPVEGVFDYLSDPRNEQNWLPGGPSSIEKTSDGPIGLGSTFVGQYQRAGRVELELVEFARPHRVTFRAHSKVLDFDDAVELTPAGNGTQLHAKMTAEPRGLMRVAAPLLARSIRRQFAGNWDHLRRALER
jgi:carbon monoxide dehydrogenase subunit G